MTEEHLGPLQWGEEKEESSKPLTLRIVAEGKVQNVGFRQWLKKKALERELRGWVRNRSNETLEALLHGPERSVREVVALCYQGPPAGCVRRVKEFPENGLRHVAQGFLVLPTL